MQRFDDKVVIITGAGSGIGQAAALRIAEEGGSVACLDVNQAGLDETLKNINAINGKAQSWRCDVSDPASVTQCFDEVIETYGKLNALCNVAGILRFDHTTELKLEDWNKIINVNLTGTFLSCQAAIPALLKTRGSIVNMASTAALGAHAWTAAYSASKGGVFSLTKCLSVEYAKQGINANSVSPASIATPMSKDVALPEGFDQSILDKVMPWDGPPRPPAKIASIIAFLASDDAEHLNGIDIRADGGIMT